MTDREMIELAAKAAGMVVEYDEIDGRFHIVEEGRHPDTFVRWRPLADDGDALRLAVKLGFDIYVTIGVPWEHEGAVQVGHPNRGKISLEKHKGDPYVATRRAIVRAAAEIGKTMP